MAELVDRILSFVRAELPLLHGFYICSKEVWVSLTKSFPTPNTQSKTLSRVQTIKLFQQPVIAGSIVAVIDDAVIFGVLTGLIFAVFDVLFSRP
jgi:hypothetical protein